MVAGSKILAAMLFGSLRHASIQAMQVIETPLTAGETGFLPRTLEARPRKANLWRIEAGRVGV